MSQRSVVELVEEWQTGFFLVIGTALVGIVSAAALYSLDVPYGRLVGGLGGAALAFLAFSYLLYGR